MDFNKLREKHKQFVFNSFEVVYEGVNLKVTFNFLITPDVSFKPQVVFPNVSKERVKEIGIQPLKNLAFNLGMVELLSYWKAACPPEIVIKAGFLNEEQIIFFKNLLKKGLGEFFYNNKVDFTKEDLVGFTISYLGGRSEATPRVLTDRDLVLVGGGKDSAVTLEEIISSKKENKCLMLNPTTAAIEIVKASGSKGPIIIKRVIDPKLLELNEQGYLNGHTPFSAYLAFLSMFAGVLYDYKNLVVSNEASSNEANIVWMGQEINHQYSKTEEFEKVFRSYSQKYLVSDANYYSYLRSVGELEISEKFAKLEKYHKLFRSCNKGSNIGIWCGKCPKCVSTYLLLYPFLGRKTKEIFGKDILEDESLLPILKGLLRENDTVKPFECVATVAEIKGAIYLGLLRARKDGKAVPRLLQVLLPPRTLILGFSREGKATFDYLKKHFPDMETGTADEKDGKNYLDKLKEYDVIVKTPGIPYLPEIKKAQKEGKIITSATQIFFDNFKGKIIGVTGTKGKSTTSSLIYEVLKEDGLDVYLAGNIGVPVLDLLEKVNENSIVVFELSSFQLEDLQKSPHIAVITNLYPEHFDHHRNFSNYQASKFNITKYQTKSDYFIYNNDDPNLQEFAQKTSARTLPIINDRQKTLKFKTNLLGEFNEQNIAAAVTVGQIFKIADEKILKAIESFSPLPHRLEFVGQFKGIKFYNDSLATIPQATVQVLKALREDVETLIAGGFDRGIDYSVLGKAIAKSNIKNLILFPDTGERIWEAAQNSDKSLESRVKKFDVNNMQEAVELAFQYTSPGKIVLLSPASSSFNLFKDYADRGNQFKEAIKNYSQAV